MLTPHTSNEDILLLFCIIIRAAIKLSFGIGVSMLHFWCSIEIPKVQHRSTKGATIIYVFFTEVPIITSFCKPHAEKREIGHALPEFGVIICFLCLSPNVVLQEERSDSLCYGRCGRQRACSLKDTSSIIQ